MGRDLAEPEILIVCFNLNAELLNFEKTIDGTSKHRKGSWHYAW